MGTLGDVAESPRRGIKPSEVPEDTPYIGLEHMPRRSIALTEWEGAGKVTSNKSVSRKGEFLFGKLRPYFFARSASLQSMAYAQPTLWLEQAVARYHASAISTVEVLQELIDLAHEIREARKRGEEDGLSPDEIAFYDALAQNESAVDVMGNDSLKIIAHELLEGLKTNVTVDWSHRESARARMRVLVKRILRRHGYPPDLQDAAVRTVLQQAEALAGQWVG